MSLSRIEQIQIISKEFIAEYRDLNAAKPDEAKFAVCKQFDAQIDKIDDANDVFKFIEDLGVASTKEQIKHHWGLPFNIKLHKPDSALGLTLHAIRAFVIAQMKETVEFEQYIAKQHAAYYHDIADIDERFAQFQLTNRAKHVDESLQQAEKEFHLRRAALGDARFILRASRRGFLSCWDRPSRSAIPDSSEPKVLTDKVKPGLSSSPSTPIKEPLLSPASSSSSPQSTPSTPVRQLAFASPVSSPATSSIASIDRLEETKDSKYTLVQMSTHIPYTFTPEFHLWFYEEHIQHKAVAKFTGEDKLAKRDGFNKFVENIISGARQKARAALLAAKLAAIAEEAKKPSTWAKIKNAISPDKKAQVTANGESKRGDHLSMSTPTQTSSIAPTASGPATPTKSPSPKHSYASLSALSTSPQHKRVESADGVKTILQPWS